MPSSLPLSERTLKTLRLLGLTNFYPPTAGGGYGEICADVMAALAARGHDVTMLVHAGASERGVEVRAELDYVLGAWRRPVAGSRAARNDSGLVAGALPHVDAALVWHMRGLSKAPLRLLHRAGTPVLYFLHDRWVLYEKPGALHVPWARLRSDRIAREGIGCFVSRWLRDEYARRGWRARREEIVPCGVDVSKFRREAPPTSPARTALYAGRVDRAKGLHVALDAVARVPGLRLTVVGPGEGGYAEEMRARARNLDVDWLGEVPRDEVRRLLATHDVLVYPSIGVEAYSLGLLEGLAAGIGIVTSAQGGPQEYLRDGVNARVVPPGDVGALAQALREPVVAGRLPPELELERVVDRVEALLSSAGTA